MASKRFKRQVEKAVNKRLQKEMASDKKFDKQVNALENQYNQRLSQGREEGRRYADQFMNRQFQGLQPQQRQALQETANSQLQRDLQNQNRMLMGSQGRAGVRGGAAFAQRAELGRQAMQAQQQMQRDLSQLDADERRANMGMAYGIESGEAANRLLTRQRAEDMQEARNLERMQNKQASRAYDALRRSSTKAFSRI